MFRRIECILAAFTRGEFNEVGLCKRLDAYLEMSATVERPSRKQTMAGIPVVWSEP